MNIEQLQKLGIDVKWLNPLNMAFEKYGFCKAFSVTINRCRDCHPFSGRAYIDYP